MTTELPCAMAGCPSSKCVIVGLTIYYFVLFFVLACWFTYLWSIIQGAMYMALEEMKSQPGADLPIPLEFMKTVVGTVGTEGPLVAKILIIDDQRVMAIPDSMAVPAVMASGMFGGLIHAIRATYYHVIEGDFSQADAIKMFLRPYSGAILALLFFLVLRAGLGDGSDKQDEGASIIFYLAVGGIVGMFTDQTVAKLKKIAEAILSKPDNPKEEEAQQSGN